MGDDVSLSAGVMVMSDNVDDTRRLILETVRRFVRHDVLPTVMELEKKDEYPQALLSQMAELGLFGMLISPEYGGLGLPYTIVAEVLMELSQGWMSLSGALTAHGTVSSMIQRFGTEEQKQQFLPRMASGEMQFCFSMTEPDAGTDAQQIRTRAVREGDEWVITGTKTWATHALNGGGIMLLAVTDPDQKPRHHGISAFIIDKPPGVSKLEGLTIPRKLPKLGYKGVESTEIVFEGFRLPADGLLGGDAGLGKGFKYFMSGLESGRIHVAASATGIATGALNRAIAYAKERKTFGRPIAEHQAIQLRIAHMAIRVEASRLLILNAATKLQSGERSDLECGMAKVFATETAAEVALDSMRVHGGYGYSTEFTIERFYREAPVLILGEGSNEINQVLIARQLLS
jgi:alkylation response protein AidB-like acyl-CoA dehydrogenase